MTPQPHTVSRDLERERAFMAEAAGFAEPDEFTSHCRARLAQGDAEFGSRWATIGFARFLTELSEEAADIGAWAALAEQALDYELDLTGAQRGDARVTLAAIARHGARAHLVIDSLARRLGYPIERSVA